MLIPFPPKGRENDDDDDTSDLPQACEMMIQLLRFSRDKETSYSLERTLVQLFRLSVFVAWPHGCCIVCFSIMYGKKTLLTTCESVFGTTTSW